MVVADLLIDTLVESFVHGFLWFREPSKEVGVQFHLLCEVSPVEVLLLLRKLLKGVFDVILAQWQWLAP